MKIKYKGKWYEVITIHELDGIKWYEIIKDDKYEVPVVDYVQDKDIENIEENYEKYRNRCAELKNETEGLIREHDETTFKENENFMENKDLNIELYLDFENETEINKTSLLYALKHDPYSGEPDVNIGRAFKDGVYWGLKCKLIKKIEEKLSEKDYGFDSGDSEYGYKSCLNDLLTWVNNIDWLID